MVGMKESEPPVLVALEDEFPETVEIVLSLLSIDNGRPPGS